MIKRKIFQAKSLSGQTGERWHINVPLLPEEMRLLDKRWNDANLTSRAEYIRTLVFADLMAAGMVPNGDENGES